MTPEEERLRYGRVRLQEAISPEAKQEFEALKAINDPAAKDLSKRMEEQTITREEVEDVAGNIPELLQPAIDALVIAKALELDCKGLVTDAEEFLRQRPDATDQEIAKSLLEKIANRDVPLISAVARKMLKE